MFFFIILNLTHSLKVKRVFDKCKMIVRVYLSLLFFLNI
jgi:hypothetical protein